MQKQNRGVLKIRHSGRDSILRVCWLGRHRVLQHRLVLEMCSSA
jgi:hypothetical protein